MSDHLLNYCARVRSKLSRRPRDVLYAHIADATGVPEHWIKSFAARRFERPKIEYVKAVENFLNNSDA